MIKIKDVFLVLMDVKLVIMPTLVRVVLLQDIPLLVLNVCPNVVMVLSSMEDKSVMTKTTKMEMDVLHLVKFKTDGFVQAIHLPARKSTQDLNVEMESLKEAKPVMIKIHTMETDVQVHAKFKTDGNAQELHPPAVLPQSLLRIEE